MTIWEKINVIWTCGAGGLLCGFAAWSLGGIALALLREAAGEIAARRQTTESLRRELATERRRRQVAEGDADARRDTLVAVTAFIRSLQPDAEIEIAPNPDYPETAVEETDENRS